MKPSVIVTLLGLKGLTAGFCAIAVILAQRLPEKPEMFIGASAAGFLSACFAVATVSFLLGARSGRRR
jgi:hypothetical protein